MNLREQLLVEHSKKNALKIAYHIIDNPSKINQLINIFLGKQPIISQRAAMVIAAIHDLNSKLLKPFINEFIKALKEEDKHHIAIIRVILRTFQKMDIPNDKAPELIDYCGSILSRPKSPIAVKAFSINILTRYCKKYPELKNELQFLLESLLIREHSPGIQNCGRKALKTINII